MSDENPTGLEGKEYELYKRLMDDVGKISMRGDAAAAGAAYQLLTRAPSPQTERGRQMMGVIEHLKGFYRGIVLIHGGRSQEGESLLRDFIRNAPDREFAVLKQGANSLLSEWQKRRR